MHQFSADTAIGDPLIPSSRIDDRPWLKAKFFGSHKHGSGAVPGRAPATANVGVAWSIFGPIRKANFEARRYKPALPALTSVMTGVTLRASDVR
jgi:hypothetical protein